MTDTKTIETTTDRKSLRFIERSIFPTAIFLMFLGSLSFFISAFRMLNDYQEVALYFMVIGFLALAVWFIEQSWYEHAIRYNRNSVLIVINRFRKQYGFRFSSLRSVELNDNILTVKVKSNDIQRIDLSTIKVEDQEKLVKFLKDRMS